MIGRRIRFTAASRPDADGVMSRTPRPQARRPVRKRAGQVVSDPNRDSPRASAQPIATAAQRRGGPQGGETAIGQDEPRGRLDGAPRLARPPGGAAHGAASR